MNSAETSPLNEKKGAVWAWLWGLLLLLGIGCRFYGLNWDGGAQLHPDERFCLSLVPRLTLPTSLGDFFNSGRSPLNPANLPDIHYVYGQLPLFIGKAVAALIGRSQGDFLLLGRFLAALFDSGTVLFTFLIARRLFPLAWALFAATLVAGAALHIQQSHFFVTDPFAACFLTASFWGGTRLLQRRKWLDALLMGALFGAALACKISAALFGVAVLGFLLWYGLRNGFRKGLLGALVCALATVVVFRLGHPMAFRGELWGGFFDLRPEPRFWGEVSYQGAITRGIIDVPFNVQWVGRTPWLFTLKNLGAWGYGWLLLLSGGAGFVLLVRRPRAHGILLLGAVFALVLLGIQGAAFSKFTRYFLPLTPFLALLATHFCREMAHRRATLRYGAGLVALTTTLWGLSVASIYGRPHTRLAASQWIVQNIAPGTVVANETPWDDALPLAWTPQGTGGLNSISLDTFDPDTPQKRDNMANRLDAAQWIFLSSGRSWQDIPRWSEKWPMTTEFYRALFDGRLGFRLEKRFTSFPALGPLQFPDASAEEAITVYDHPMVMLFHKDASYSGAKTRQILGRVSLPENQEWMPKDAPKPDERGLPLPPH